MNKIKTIQLKAFFLLLVYIASVLPVSLFHTHKSEIVSFKKASACEKKIYYGDVAGSCEHSKHVSKQIKKCTLCEHQLVLPYTGVDTIITTKKFLYSNTFTIEIVSCLTYNSSTASNRGPPTII